MARDPELVRMRQASHFSPIRARSLSVGLSLCACGGSDGTEDELAANAPVVIATEPRDGEGDVDPALQQITVTFSEAMDPDGWSWVTEIDQPIPSITGLPYYIDDTTSVLPVRLEPATSYALWVNSPEDAELRKFTSISGISARAHRIGFTTGSDE